MKNTLQQITDRVSTMPSISSNTVHILNLISNSDYAVKDLIKLVSLDIALSTRCLQVVNSASFGLGKPVTSIDRAVNFLGNRGILGIVIKQSFGQMFSNPLKGYLCEENGLWNHSLRTAIASRQIAQMANKYEVSDVVYTAGLLLDIGKVIISEFLANYNSDLNEKYRIGSEMDFPSVESNILRTNHAEVGYMLANKWNFPDTLQAAIRFHHNPGAAPEKHKLICAMVHFGDIMAMLGGFGTGFDSMAYRLDSTASDILKLNDNDISNLYISIELEYEEIQKFFFNLDPENKGAGENDA